MSAVGLLDTCVVIEIANPGFALESLPQQSLISSVTLGELSAGPLLASDPTEASARLRVLQAAEEVFGASVVPYDAAAARVFGSVVTDVVRRGRSPRSRIGDLQIAAIAIANRLPLYTINVGDFTGIRNLEVVPVPPCPDVIGATSNPI
ncbi:MAG: type II toxin-antitoxin system VapC family toxin [Actinomycetota bacterium]|nr:type II toxin-antitoxin system VapC family toxin [Actinomycetota bacterium]